MIKVTVLYPNEEGKNFDFDYWAGAHMEIVHRLLDPMGLSRSELERGVSAADPNAPAPFRAMATLYFNTEDEVHEGFKTHGRKSWEISRTTPTSPPSTRSAKSSSGASQKHGMISLLTGRRKTRPGFLINPCQESSDDTEQR